ncbi:hypothetical protein ACVIHF_008774 [Bradyrhizobium sp. USDA 4506]
MRPSVFSPIDCPLRRNRSGSPLGVTSMRAGHVVGIGAVLAAAVTAMVSRNTRTPMQQLEGSGGGANVDPLPDLLVGNRVKEPVDLDMIIERDVGHAPFRELIIGIRQRRQDRHLDRLEQSSTATVEPAHNIRVDPLKRGDDCRVGLD